MDIRFPCKYLSLVAAFFCILLAVSCTDVVYADIKIQVREGNETSKKVKQRLLEVGWFVIKEKEDSVILQNPKSHYVYLYFKANEREIDLSMSIAGANIFEQKDIELYRELVDKLVEKFGDDVSFDKETSKGQPLF